MEDDWDLFAVVRSCSAATRNTSPSSHQEELTVPCLEDTSKSNLYEEEEEEEEANDPFIYSNPFFINAQTVLPHHYPQSQTLPPISPLSVLTGLQDDPHLHLLVSSDQNSENPLLSIQTEHKIADDNNKAQMQKPSWCSKSLKPQNNPTTTRSKRRKDSMKKVCHVGSEDLASDKWCWRKYGQKPIKGSPYPRGYYRCSTSKGCLARKQVERNPSRPSMFILTYTGEHNHPVPAHRNSLAGTTRPAKNNSPEPEPEPEMEMEGKEEGGETDMANLDDDFFAGLEDFTAADGGGGAAHHFPAAVLFSRS